MLSLKLRNQTKLIANPSKLEFMNAVKRAAIFISEFDFRYAETPAKPEATLANMKTYIGDIVVGLSNLSPLVNKKRMSFSLVGVGIF